MKFPVWGYEGERLESLPIRGAWIEICYVVRGHIGIAKSLPIRGAWIEIYSQQSADWAYQVAPHPGSVD